MGEAVSPAYQMFHLTEMQDEAQQFLVNWNMQILNALLKYLLCNSGFYSEPSKNH